MPKLMAFKAVAKLNPEIVEREPNRKPRQRLMVGFGGKHLSGVVTMNRVLFYLDELEVMAALNMNLDDFPETPVRVKLALEILEK